MHVRLTFTCSLALSMSILFTLTFVTYKMSKTLRQPTTYTEEGFAQTIRSVAKKLSLAVLCVSNLKHNYCSNFWHFQKLVTYAM